VEYYEANSPSESDTAKRVFTHRAGRLLSGSQFKDRAAGGTDVLNQLGSIHTITDANLNANRDNLSEVVQKCPCES